MLGLGLALILPAAGGCERDSAPHDAVAARPAAAEPTAERPQITTAVPPEALALVRPARLREHVEFLAADARRGRPTPSPQLDESARYIREHFVRLGLQAPGEAPDYEQRFECGGPGHPGLASNVLGLLPGTDPSLGAQTLMIGGHYDHLGERLDEHPTSPDEADEDRIFNGANDNASGIAAMLIIAEVLAAAPPRRSVLFVAFCGEERMLVGSSYYVEHPVRPLDSVIAYLNLEMLGRPGPAQPPTAWLPGAGRSDLLSWLTAANPGEVRFVDGYEIGPTEGAAYERSDNYPLAKAGVIAHTIASGPLDALYHSVDDEVDRLELDRMAVIVRGITRGAHALANHPDRPQWIDPPKP